MARALVEPGWLDRIFLPYDQLLAHGRFVHDRAVAVEGRRVQTGYLRGSLADALDGSGYVRVDANLRVRGEDRVFAVGDIADADRDMAGKAGAEAKVVAANIRSLVTGKGELATYEQGPPVILIPLGPTGGAGQLPGMEEIAGAELAASLKGEHMLIDHYAAMFAPSEPTS